MNKRLAMGLMITGLGLSTTVLFQNCGKGFDASQVASQSSSSSSVPISHDTPHIMPTGDAIAGSDISFMVHDEDLSPSATYIWSYFYNGTSGVGCNLKSTSMTDDYVINCPNSGSLEVRVAVTDGGQSISVAPYTATLVAASNSGGSTNPTGQINMTVTFTISPGTGTGAWNSSGTMVETFIGQTLKIVNNDSVNQQLHTNGVPFAHGSLIAPGASASEVVLSTYTLAANGALYNHLVGTQAPFYMVAYDGNALYATNCAGCHGALASSNKKFSEPSDIKTGIANVASMKTAALMGLTTRQIEAISSALGGQ